MHLPLRRRRALLALPLLASALLPAAAQATSTPTQISTSVTNGVTYLKSLQQLDGRFSTGATSPSLDWTLSALAAAGVAAADAKVTGGADARTYYRGLLSPSTWPGSGAPVTDFERASLNAYAAGIDPARVSVNQNLVAGVLGMWSTSDPGYYGTVSNFNGTVFALLALAGARTTSGGALRVPQALLDKSIAKVKANQHTDGGWTFNKVEGNPSGLASAGDVDMTGAAIASLCASGVANTDAAVVAGKNFLKGKLVNGSGAFNSLYGVNTNSNGWGVQGLNVCGFGSQSADFTTALGYTPIDFLRAQQFSPGGGFKYLTSDTTPNAYASIDAVRALAGGGFTATPPVPASAAQWVATTSFTSGTPSKLGLVIDDGSGTLKVCSSTITPTGTTTTLGAVLDAAISSSSPAGCVSALTPSAGGGTITTLNGTANAGSNTWKSRVDGGTAVAANRSTTINLGDTIALTYGP